jgi:hypothetical protein
MNGRSPSAAGGFERSFEKIIVNEQSTKGLAISSFCAFRTIEESSISTVRPKDHRTCKPLLRFPIQNAPIRNAAPKATHHAWAIKVPDQLRSRMGVSKIAGATLPSDQSGYESVSRAWPDPT